MKNDSRSNLSDTEWALIDYTELPPDAINPEQLWLLVDRRNLVHGVRRCFFPNKAMVERCIRTMLHQNPEVKACPSDFVFVHLANVWLNPLQEYCIQKCFDEYMEFKDYAN